MPSSTKLSVGLSRQRCLALIDRHDENSGTLEEIIQIALQFHFATAAKNNA